MATFKLYNSCWLCIIDTFIMQFPNLFLVGSPKSATTSLAHELGINESIFLPKIKEPHFFSSGFPLSRQKDLVSVKLLEKYLKLYKHSHGFKYRIDASTSYLYCEAALEKISNLESTKIIVILRNPIDRYISHYQNDVLYGYEKRQLKETIHKEACGNSCIPFSYYECGLYCKYLKLWASKLPSASLCIVDYDFFIKSKKECLEKIYQFLEIDSYGLIYKTEIKNSAHIPRAKFLYFLYNFFPLRTILRNIFPSKLKKFIKEKIIFKKGKLQIVDKSKCERILKSLYKDEMMNFKKLLLNKEIMRCGNFSFLDEFI